MLVKPENLRGAANICSDSGKRPLAAMFGADETCRAAVWPSTACSIMLKNVISMF